MEIHTSLDFTTTTRSSLPGSVHSGVSNPSSTPSFEFQSIHKYPNSEIVLCSIDWLTKNVYFPKFQRQIDQDRVSEIVNELSKRKEPTGIIILGKDKTKYNIIDGQHRFEAYKRLNISPIIVQIDYVDNEDQIQQRFANINKLVPIDSYVLTARQYPQRPPRAVRALRFKEMLDKLFKYISETYREYKSAVSDTNMYAFRFPNINLKALTDHIGCIPSKIPFVEESNTENIIENFLLFNEECKSELSESDIIQCEKKKVKNGKYLYISKSLRQVMKDSLKEDDDRKITEDLRKAVWSKRNGEYVSGKCYSCSKSITFGKFECGHIIAWSQGGKTELNNLEPICKQCNVKSQDKNLLEYKSSLMK